MAKALSILYVSSEVFPFAKVGGIGDVAFSLPLAIREIGHDIRVMMPKYGIISERRNKIHEINRLRDMEIEIGENTYYSTVKSSSINNPKAKVQAYVSTNLNYFDQRKGIYFDVKTGEEFPDNDERFAFFCKSVVETCNMLGWVPDIIHCNDWQTALVPAFAKLFHPKKFAKTKFILTIHNISQQGQYPAKNFAKLLVSEEEKDNFIHKNKLNFLKAGIMYSDAVNTVSPTYCNEILQDKKHSNGLCELLMDDKKKFQGIINGVDSYFWNPKLDTHLQNKFEESIPNFKAQNKEQLLNEFSISPERASLPLVAMITRLSEQKGLDLLVSALPKLLKEDMNFIMLAEGDAEYKEKIKEIYKDSPNNFAFKFANDEPLTHKIEAGSDFLLMPSKFEPCGLNALYSLAYGSIPIVHNVGGLSEIIEDYNAETGEGNGFKFDGFTATELLKAAKRAFELYADKEQMLKLLERVMNEDYSWKESAKAYITLYTNTLKEKE